MPVNWFTQASIKCFLYLLLLWKTKSLPLKYHPNNITVFRFMHTHLHCKRVQSHKQHFQNSTAVLQNFCNKTRDYINTVNTKDNFFLFTLLTNFVSDIMLSSWQADCLLPYFIMTRQCNFARFSCLLSALVHSDATHWLSTFLQYRVLFRIYWQFPPFSTHVSFPKNLMIITFPNTVFKPIPADIYLCE